MKNLIFAVVVAILLHANTVLGATGNDGGGIGLMAKIFLAFFAAIIVFQLIPALILFGSLIVAIFSRSSKKDLAESESVSDST